MPAFLIIGAAPLEIAMRRHSPAMIALTAALFASLAPGPTNVALAQGQANKAAPPFVRRGLPGPGHAALKPLIGTFRLHKEIYGTFGRTGSEPPIVSDNVICRRAWVAGGRWIEDTTEGTVIGGPYWRRGWLGYSTMDRRYEWVTIDAVNTTLMTYLGRPGSGPARSFQMSGVFTDQGVAGEATVGKRLPMRTVFRIESNDRHVVELYFTRPNGKEVLADRSTYTRVRDK
jgi:hypothetical protein